MLLQSSTLDREGNLSADNRVPRDWQRVLLDFPAFSSSLFKSALISRSTSTRLSIEWTASNCLNAYHRIWVSLALYNNLRNLEKLFNGTKPR